MTSLSPPLAGIRILDFTRLIAGPLCTQHLSDLGAEVVKVENPVTGDEVRGWDPGGAPGRSAFFTAFNRNKKSVAIDLKRERGQQLARHMARHCDVVIENFRPGVMGRLGLDQERLRQADSRLIYVSVSAYGASGELSDRPGLDPVLQAESGMMAMTGMPDGPPMRHPLSLIDTLTAAQALGAITTAIIARERTGRGDFVDLCLYDTAIAALNNAALSYFTDGELPPRTGNSHMLATPVNLFRTKTEPIYVAAGSDRLFKRLCEDVLERPDLAVDPRFEATVSRREHREELLVLIEDIFLGEPAAHWLKRLRHLPAGVVRTMDQALAAPETLERNMVWEVADEERHFRMLGSPFKFTDYPLSEPAPPPRLGQHTDAVLRDLLGFDEIAIAELRSASVIR
jgi:crotonobetainyl-CoA:carnitine CoA-transferase CaiB-like acyl-CoA transferase